MNSCAILQTLQPASRQRPPSASTTPPDRKALGLTLAAALLAPALPAQWSADPGTNTFVDASCSYTLQRMVGPGLALDPVVVACNNGCFHVWRDNNGVVNIQVIDDCGHRALGTPYQIPGTGDALPFAITEIAGAAYGNNTTGSGVNNARNEMLLAYTVWDPNLHAQKLFADTFRFATVGGVPTLLPSTSGPMLLHTGLGPYSAFTPVVDSRVVTTGENGAIDGAVLGWRTWSLTLNGAVDIFLGHVTGPAATPTATACAVVDSFIVGSVNPPRLSVVGDATGRAFAMWRRPNPGGGMNWVLRFGFHDGGGCSFSSGPVDTPATSRDSDDWVVASDLQGGVFWANKDDAGTTLGATHVSSVGASRAFPPVATNGSGWVQALAAVGIGALGTQRSRAALAYREGVSVWVLELSESNTGVVLGRTKQIHSETDFGRCRASAVLSHRGVALAWTWDNPRGSPERFVFGQEIRTSDWTILWHGHNKTISKNVNSELKYAPRIVRKHTIPEVIFAWVDDRLSAPGPGAYVQSVADDFLVLLRGFGLRHINGKLGSSLLCIEFGTVFEAILGIPRIPLINGSTTVTGFELFTIDPIQQTPTLVKDINPGAVSSTPSRGMNVGHRQVFAATSAASGRELWVTDGTNAGTLQLVDIEPGPGSSAPLLLGEIGGRILFSASSAATGRELWLTDGTSAGTTLLTELQPAAASGVASSISSALLGGRRYFWGSNGGSGAQLWSTDGTAAGTLLATDMDPGNASAIPGQIVRLGDHVLLTAAVASVGSEPFTFDPATATTTLLRDIRPGSQGSASAQFLQVGTTLYFTANDGLAGSELWATDGTSAGTRLVADIRPGPAGSSPGGPTVAGNGAVWFAADDGVHGREPWRSDGTAGGTTMVADVFSGPSGSNPLLFVSLGRGQVVFSAASDATDREPWITDGTANGTQRLVDLNPGPAGSNPHGFRVVDGALWFGGDSPSGAVTLRFELEGAVPFGTGCPGTGGLTPSLFSAGGVPAPGNAAFRLELTDAAARAPSLMLLGTSEASIPFGGCTLLVGPPAGSTFAITDNSGNATIGVPVPNNPGLVGLTLFSQWATLDPAGPAPGGATLSNGVRITIDP